MKALGLGVKYLVKDSSQKLLNEMWLKLNCSRVTVY